MLVLISCRCLLILKYCNCLRNISTLSLEREFDADKHCGVWVAELQKQCTRSLTCKVGERLKVWIVLRVSYAVIIMRTETLVKCILVNF